MTYQTYDPVSELQRTRQVGDLTFIREQPTAWIRIKSLDSSVMEVVPFDATKRNLEVFCKETVV